MDNVPKKIRVFRPLSPYFTRKNDAKRISCPCGLRSMAALTHKFS